MAGNKTQLHEKHYRKEKSKEKKLDKTRKAYILAAIGLSFLAAKAKKEIQLVSRLLNFYFPGFEA